MGNLKEIQMDNKMDSELAKMQMIDKMIAKMTNLRKSLQLKKSLELKNSESSTNNNGF